MFAGRTELELAELLRRRLTPEFHSRPVARPDLFSDIHTTCHTTDLFILVKIAGEGEMHEYRLFSRIPAARYEQVLHILAGVTASEPAEIREQHLVYRPLTSAQPQVPSKASATASRQVQRPTYQKLVRDIRDGESRPWVLRVEQVPEPGIDSVISQAVSETMLETNEQSKFRSGSQFFRYV